MCAARHASPSLPVPVSRFIIPLYWLAFALVVAGQAMILHLTVRAMRSATSPRARRAIEWAYALIPAAALILVLGATRQAAIEHAARAELEARANLTSQP